MGRTGLGGVMHCFGGGWEQARRSLDMGFLISFAGNLTYPKAQPLRDVAARLPLDGLLVETDAPWLAPVPSRGKRNEPAWVALTAKTLAGLQGAEVPSDRRGDDEKFQSAVWLRRSRTVIVVKQVLCTAAF